MVTNKSQSMATSDIPWKGRARFAAFTRPEVEFKSIVLAGWRSFSSEIDLSAFVKKSRWNSDKIFKCLRHIRYCHPELFFVNGKASIKKWSSANGHLSKIVLMGIKYDFDATEYHVRKYKFDQVVNEAMSCIGGIVDEAEKALKLHDFLAGLCDYDIVALKDSASSYLARSAYSALVRRKAVCEGYAMAYYHLMNMAGIASGYAHGIGISHIWNYVRVNGNWYHVDVTWDDPVYKGIGRIGKRISHENFLMSDKKAKETGHKCWDVCGLPKAIDERFDNSLWQGQGMGEPFTCRVFRLWR